MARSREPYDDDEADAPWLASVDEEREPSTLVSQRKLIGGIALFLGLLALIVGGIYAITSGQRQGGSTGEAAVSAEDVPLIAADPGPYKIRPTDPGGMQIDGAGETMYATGEGAEIGGAIDPNALPEDPMARPTAPGAPGAGEPQDLLPPTEGASEMAAIPPARGGQVPRPAPTLTMTPRTPPAVIPTPRTPPPAVVAALRPLPKPVAAPAPGTPPAKPSTGSGALQLGAFSSSAKADATWTALSKRFSYLAGLSKSVQKVERDGTTLYRLRAVGVDRSAATDLCSRLKVAGEECIVAQ